MDNKQQLTIKELAPYLPYSLKGWCMGLVEDDYAEPTVPIIVEMVGLNGLEVETKNGTRTVSEGYLYCDFMPHMRPLSDLTKEELKEQGFWHHIDYLTHEKQNPLTAPYEMVQYLFSKHYDVFGLIEKGLATRLE